MKNRQSVFHYGYTKRYYLCHPLKFLKDTWLICKAGWRRATKGWCYGDCWDMDTWFLDVVPEMLKHLADYGCGYKGDSPEEWHDHLYGIANLLENAREDVRDQKNEYAEAYKKELQIRAGGGTYSPTDTVKSYYRRDRELAEEQDIMIEEALKLIAETPLKALWD